MKAVVSNDVLAKSCSDQVKSWVIQQILSTLKSTLEEMKEFDILESINAEDIEDFEVFIYEEIRAAGLRIGSDVGKMSLVLRTFGPIPQSSDEQPDEIALIILDILANQHHYELLRTQLLDDIRHLKQLDYEWIAYWKAVLQQQQQHNEDKLLDMKERFNALIMQMYLRLC